MCNRCLDNQMICPLQVQPLPPVVVVAVVIVAAVVVGNSTTVAQSLFIASFFI